MRGRPKAKRFFTEKEYLAMERDSDRKHEYFRGEIFAMGGGSPKHNLVSAGFVGEIRAALKGRRGCRVFGSDQRVRVSAAGLYTYPDVTVVCGARYADDAPDTLVNPQVIIEVLSEGTEDYDRTDKFDLYRGLASLREYVIARQDEVRVEHFALQADGGWLLREVSAGQRLHLGSVDVEVALDDIYTGLFDED